MGNTFGTLFRILTWGESHGKAVGVVIDGCPAGLPLGEDVINAALERRAPGRHPHTSPRHEPDRAEILSGVFEGKTTGAPICISVRNVDADPSKYTPIRHLLRPGHANFTYLKKYGIFDYRGGGRASARETVGRVAAGAVARQFLQQQGITIPEATLETGDVEAAKEAGDSVGGTISLEIQDLPVGLGEPIYGKIEALLASAMLSLPAAKGFEMGSGFAAARMRGSEHNDAFVCEAGVIRTRTNHSGGTLGGLTSGMPLQFRVAFKPTSSIAHAQETVTLEGEPATFSLPEGSRHDPCVAIRAVPVVEAMTALVLADAVLLTRGAR